MLNGLTYTIYFSVGSQMNDYKLYDWLCFVDNELSPDAFEFLKFGLHSEFHRHLTEVEVLEKPSQLYHFLLKHCGQRLESEMLKMFIHVLKGLGGKLRGNFVLRYGFGENKLENPGDFDIENASDEFRLFQCLLQILTRLRQDNKLCRKVKAKLCRVLKMNQAHFKNLPELFITLYQKQFITAEKTDLLKQVLMKYDTDHKRVNQCVEILNSIGLPLIPLAEIAAGSSGN